MLNHIRKQPKLLARTASLFVAGALLLIPSYVLASTYGSGSYNTCGYGSSCPASSSASAPSTSTTTNTPILLNDFAEFTSGSGKQVTLAVGQVIDFNIISGGQTTTYTATVTSITADTVDLKIQPGDLTVHLQVGQTKEYDVNGDGKNDIAITLSSIVDGKANLVFKAVLGAEFQKTTPVNQATATTATKKNNVAWLVGSIALIIAGLLLFLWLFIRRRRGQHFGSDQQL